MITNMDTEHLFNCKHLLESKRLCMTNLIDYKRYGKCRAYTKSPEYRAICKEIYRRAWRNL